MPRMPIEELRGLELNSVRLGVWVCRSAVV